MRDKLAWMILSEKSRTAKDMERLWKSFDKKKNEVNLASKAALKLADDIEKARSVGAEVITYIDKEYPDALRKILNPPPYLYVKGKVSALSYPLKTAIVGSRAATAYGLNTAMNFAHELSGSNICVVSGGARGIDTAALNGALRGNAPVICVIGTGIDLVYPSENARLFDKVAQKGAVVTELAPGTPALPQNFPLRNRIMTALSDSVLVVEAAEKSGALISANHASEQGKSLFAVPGSIDSPTSRGTNMLLRDGALWALSASDIIYEMMERLPDSYRKLNEYRSAEEEKPELIPLPKSEAKKEQKFIGLEGAVINALRNGQASYDEILEYCACDTRRLTSALTMMEIKGLIKQTVGNKYELEK